MCKEHDETENCVIEAISIADSIKQLEPEIIKMILEEYTDMDTYIESLENKEAASLVFEKISNSKVIEQKIVMLRFGLIDGKVKTLEEVSRLLGITRERVRRIESNALRRGCHIHYRKKMIDYLNDD